MFNKNDQKEALILTRKILDLPVLKDGEEKNYDSLIKELSEYLDHLIATDFNKLIGILYRIDISQAKATAALANHTFKESPGESLANLIIARELEKVETRKKYKNHVQNSENNRFFEEQ